MISDQEGKMANISYKVQRFLSAGEVDTKLSIFEQDLFQKMHVVLSRAETKANHAIDAKADKMEITDYIKLKANFTDL